MTKINNILFFILAAFAVLYFGASFLIPFVFGSFFALLVAPFSDLQEKIGIKRVISSLLSTLLVFIVVGGVSYIFIYQISLFVSDISAIRNEVRGVIDSIQNEITSLTNISLEQQQTIWQNRSENILTTVETRLTRFVGDIANTTAGFFLALVYVYLLLYYRNKISNAVMMTIKEEKKEEAKDVLLKISRVVFHYLWGRVKVMAILAILYYITFLIFDLPYALLLTISGALVTIIPYVGPFISGILPIFFAIIYMDSVQVIIFFTSIVVTIQLIESYVFEPMIIGKEVQINPLIVIVAIIIGGTIWGLAGMILFVPIFAIIKIISMKTQGLEAIGYLFGPSKDDKGKK